ncbi:hypothetical protein DFAR_360007 [Desulfarculales bacterium]
MRYIEYMPVGRHTGFLPQRFLAAEQLLEVLKGLGRLKALPGRTGDGPAQRYRLAGAAGELGVISALTSHFCGSCNRLRLSAEGLLARRFPIRPDPRPSSAGPAISNWPRLWDRSRPTSLASTTKTPRANATPVAICHAWAVSGMPSQGINGSIGVIA